MPAAAVARRCGYRRVPEVPLPAAIRESGALRAEAGVPLAAAALGFPASRAPGAARTVVGVSRHERIGASVVALEVAGPDDAFDMNDRVAATPPTDLGPR
ncbi:hypothetical protein SAMN06297387_1347 [Streptomyces zhaozhouensis]|uniref:Uncharacterized protein n=1 Tax=Streptomyces zhaozhouensis TaxID=1300267 RepID=A0A286EA68_9ACTN|nr:hypothetical protein [Streptomyces zhaozhouensis]SOD67788.1 hypothetical protein SAMN06297387_1347 [Streptomyces zhaozhouensis]